MNLWILDTDHTSLFLIGVPAVRDRVFQSFRDVATSIVTVQESFNGWITLINDPAEADNLVELYLRLSIALDFFRAVRVYSFDEAAWNVHQQLLKNNPNLNKKRLQRDMRIAAIALSQNATLVTRNYRDFSQVPGLAIENWVV